MKTLIGTRVLNQLKSAALIIVLTSLMVSCKQPKADFTTDKTDYHAGDVVVCTNKSTDANTYKWTFPDGQTSTSVDANYTINSSTSSGSYSIKLEAFSKNGNKSSVTTKTINVKGPTGQLTVFTTGFAGLPASVKIGNVYYGNITISYSSIPSCGANGCITANLLPGTYNVTVSTGTITITEIASVGVNQCTVLRVL